MTDTNWPNPERPGWPPNPDKDGLYALRAGAAFIARYWSATRQHYTSVQDWKRGMSPFDASSFDFAGEILTPTQIAEMLAGERERCAVVLDRLKNKEQETYGIGLMTTRAEITIHALALGSEEIRNLGAAP